MSNHNPPKNGFKPGVSGHPGGRQPASKNFADALARFGKLTQRELRERWDTKDGSKLSCEEHIALGVVFRATFDSDDKKNLDRYLDRLVGRPRQGIEITGNDSSPIRIEYVEGRTSCPEIGIGIG